MPDSEAVQRGLAAYRSALTSIPGPIASPQPETPQFKAERQAAYRDQVSGSKMTASSLSEPGTQSAQSAQNSHSPVGGAQNSCPPGTATIGYSSYVAGDVNDTRRDDSFNVFGTGHNIYFSLSR